MATAWRFVLALLTVPAVALALVLGPINVLARDLGFMERGFVRYNVTATTGLSLEQLRYIAQDIIAYWDNDQALLTTTVTKDRQQFVVFGGPQNKQTTHMRDVKALFRLSTGVWTGALVVLAAAGIAALLTRKNGALRAFASGTLGGSVLILGVLVVLGLIAAIDFNRFWTAFHLVSFSNDEWLLDPRTDYLIMMFPLPFWSDAVTWVVGWTAGLSAALALLSFGYLRISHGRHRSGQPASSVLPTSQPSSHL